MERERILSTNAFDAFRTEHGFVIEENSSAYRKTGILAFVFGAICTAFSFVIAEAPIKELLILVLDYGLFYGGLIAVFGGLLYLLMSFKIIKKKTIELDGEHRVLQLGRRKVSFDSIENFSCEINQVFGRTTAKIKVREDGISTLLVGPPVVVKKNADALRAFVGELNQLLVKSI